MAIIGRSLCRATLIVAVSATVATAAGAQVTGRATALGADVLLIAGQTFQLWGVDAVEFHQSCFVDGRPWACGASALRALQTFIDPAVATCTPTGGGGAAMIAVCLSGADDVAEFMVRQGWARAHGPGADDYRAAEEAARADRAGIWQGQFVDPWEYRDDVTAIERTYTTRTAEALAPEAERRLTVDGDTAAPLQGFTVTRIEITGVVASVTEITLGIAPFGAISDGGGPRDVFDWAIAARNFRDWRSNLTGVLERTTTAALWEEFNGLPGPVVPSTDAITFFDAMTEAAAPLIAAGRQPVLLVASIRSPDWIGGWLSGSPPDGAIVSGRNEPTAPSYRGTIDGVDIHTGPAPLNTALVFPDDILVGVAYGALANGSFVAIEIDPTADPAAVILRYSRVLNWSNDPIVRISFPETMDEEDRFYEVESP